MSKTKWATCSAAGCSRETRTGSSPFCEMHYYRMRRTGRLDREPFLREIPCAAVENCDKQAERYGHQIGMPETPMCRMHMLRMKKHGSFDYEYRGVHHKAWVDVPGYSVAHQRINREFGPASNGACTDCGGQAYHWSYDHCDPDELIDKHLGIRYSAKPEHYVARCVRCHKLFDISNVG